MSLCEPLVTLQERRAHFCLGSVHHLLKYICKSQMHGIQSQLAKGSFKIIDLPLVLSANVS